MQRMAKDPPGQAEVEWYFASVEALADSVNSLLYWKGQTNEYPLLSSNGYRSYSCLVSSRGEDFLLSR